MNKERRDNLVCLMIAVTVFSVYVTIYYVTKLVRQGGAPAAIEQTQKVHGASR